MDLEEFIITVYLLVCGHYRAVHQHTSLLRDGSAPALNDEEIITVEL